MVDELTNMNTLQEIIQVREDLDALLSASGITVPGASGSTSSTGSSSNSQNASATSAYAATNLLPGMSALSGSPSAVNAAKSAAQSLAQIRF